MLYENKPDKIDVLLQVNLNAAIQLTRLLLPSMLARRGGVVVNIASMFSRVASPEFPVYAASKSGLVAFGQSLRRQLDGTGVRVVTAYPAFTYTDMISPGMERSLKASGFQFDTPEYVAEHTLDAVLKGAREVYFGGLLEWAGAWADQHFPRLMDVYFRLTTTPDSYARGTATPSDSTGQPKASQ
jgi:short-subunit dehydrogenase